MDYEQIVNKVYATVQPYAGEGRVPDYIPALAEVNPDQFGICLETLDGQRFTAGHTDVRFSIQSISKVFALAMCLGLRGDRLWQRMGKEPSGTAFNSLVQLEYEDGRPRNPLINAGAIVMADVLLSGLPRPEEDFLDFVRAMAGCSEIDFNRPAAYAEQSVGYLNAAIANLLKYHGNVHGDIARVLEFYFLMCSVEMTCAELAHSFLPFADHGTPFLHAGVRLTASQVKRMNAIMQTCGFYDEAGEFSYLVGLPGKSGVGGGIVALCPQRYAVAVWGPRLNGKGNSIMGMKALETLTSETAESIF